MTVLRRAITVPVVTILMVLLLAAGPLLLAGAGVVGLATRSSRPARTVALLMAYAVIELRTLLKFLRGNRDCDQLIQDFLVSAYAAVRRILDVEVVLDPASAKPDAIPRDEPLIVLSRHCGPGDSVLVAWLLAVEYRLQLRVVLKAVLQCEPVLDLAGELGCLCFLSRGGRAHKQIRGLAESLGGGQAMLLFPEGANFSWPRWRNAITQLRSTGGLRAARRALRQSHTLPPRSWRRRGRGGGSAERKRARADSQRLLRRRPGPSLVAVTHSPAAAHPYRCGACRKYSTAERLEPWLERTWTQVDAWVAAHAEHS